MPVVFPYVGLFHFMETYSLFIMFCSPIFHTDVAYLSVATHDTDPDSLFTMPLGLAATAHHNCLFHFHNIMYFLKMQLTKILIWV